MFLNSIIWSPSPFQHWILKYLQIFKYLPFLKAQEWRNYYCWEGASLFLMAIAFSIIRRAELSVGLLKELILAAGLISLLCWAKPGLGSRLCFFWQWKHSAISYACSWTMNYYWYLTKVLFFWLSPLCQTPQIQIFLLEVFRPAAFWKIKMYDNQRGNAWKRWEENPATSKITYLLVQYMHRQ